MNSNNFYKYKFLTQKAFEFQPKIMSGKIMNFTKAEIGDGILENIEEGETLQSLKNKICDVKILSIVPKGHMVELTILLNGDGLNGVTLYREIGIYAQIDEEEILYAYLNSDDKFDYIIPLGEGNKREFTNNKVKITLVVGNADNINVTLNNTIIPDDSITMDMLNIEVKNYIEDIKNTFEQKNQEIESNLSQVEINLNEHTLKDILSEEGSHGIKYDESERTLKYKKDDSWENIPTGQQAETEINKHKEKSILSEEGAHDFRYDESSQKFKYKKDGTWNDINTSGSSQELEEHKEESILNEEGVHNLRWYRDKLSIKNGKEWIIIYNPKVYRRFTAKIDKNNDNPETAISYHDDAIFMTPGSDEWDDFFGVYPVLFKDGIEQSKLQKTNYSKNISGSSVDITSGDAGDVMIVFKCLATRIFTSDNILTISITDNLDDNTFKCLAFTRDKIRKDRIYYGAYKGFKDNSNKLRSLSSKTPTTNQTLSNFRNQAKNNGEGYCLTTFYFLTYLQLLYILKYKNLNSQIAVGKGFTSGSSLKVTGGTNDKGLNYGTSSGTEQIKLFGVEDLWGNANEWIDGLKVNGSREILTSNGDEYINHGVRTNKNIQGFISDVQGTDELGFIAKSVEGSATTKWADNGSVWAGYVPTFGGHWQGGNNAGIFRLSIYYAADTPNNDVGARLVYI